MIKDWHKTLHNALIKGNKELFRFIPHTDLHCHGITSVPFGEFIKISSKIKLPPRTFEDLADFNSFIQRNIVPLIKNLEMVRLLIRSTFQRLIKEGIVYTEMSFDLTMPEYLNISLEEFLQTIKEEKNRVSHSLSVCIEAGLDRGVNPQNLFKFLKQSLKYNIFGSIDLYGREDLNSIENYVGIYKLANSYNLKLKAHLGEFGAVSNIEKAIKKLNLQAIQHGISAAQSKEVMKLIVANNISLNICPSSNLAFGVVKNISKHPIRKLFDEGIIVTVNSDDYSMFGKSVSEELINLYKNNIFSEQEIIQLINNGLKQRQ